jgi:hypothetical protein
MKTFKAAILLQFTLIAGLSINATVVRANEVIFGYTGGTTRTDGGIVSGISFNTSSFGAPTVQSLGFFDSGNDGLVGSYQVGLWDSSQTLLASGTVTPSSPLVGDFRWVNVSAVTLSANSTYVVAALLPNSPPDPWLDNASLTLGAGFSGAGTGRTMTSGTLAFPTTVGASPYVIANVSDVAVSPEPGSLAMLGGAAMFLGLRRRGY